MPHIIHLPEWCRSAGHHPVELFASHSLDQLSAQRPVLLIGGVHGDEPEGVEVATQTLRLLKLRATDLSWVLIPCLNPDGYLKNPRERMNANGVDLNRNFPTPDWSPASKGPRYYPGTKPSTEPEVKALVELIAICHPRVIVHFHSDSVACNVYSGPKARPWADFFARFNGYPVKPDIGYPTPGSLGQFGIQVAQTPVICLEELERIPLTQVWPHYRPAFETLFWNSSFGREL